MINYKTLAYYIGKKFLLDLLLSILALSCIIFLFDCIELIRISSKNAMLKPLIIVQMALMKNYTVLNRILPFIALIASLKTYISLKKKNEITATLALGLSTFQIIMPAIVVTLFFSISHITLLNPAASYLYQKYSVLESKVFGHKKDLIELSKSGIWFKYHNSLKNELMILHAKSISNKQKILYNTEIFFLSEDGNFIQKINTPELKLINSKWTAQQAAIIDNKNKKYQKDNLDIQIDINLNEIVNSLATPETLNIWKILSFINIAQNMGFNTLKYTIYFWKLLFLPISLIYMMIVGYVFSVYSVRNRGTDSNIVLGLISGFFIYFLNELIISFSVNNGMGVLTTIIASNIMFLTISLYLLIYCELHK